MHRLKNLLTTRQGHSNNLTTMLSKQFFGPEPSFSRPLLNKVQQEVPTTNKINRLGSCDPPYNRNGYNSFNATSVSTDSCWPGPGPRTELICRWTASLQHADLLELGCLAS